MVFLKAVINALALTSTTICNAAVILSPEGRLINGSSLGDTQIQCRGHQFGSNLRYSSCLDAFSTFNQDQNPVPVEIGRRFTGQYAENLPWKWVSGDGRCVFDIVLKGAAPSEKTTGKEIARAAWRLVNECVRDQNGQGGVVSGIGRRGALGIIIRSYDPGNIRCGTQPQRYTEDKCSELLGDMPADVGPPVTFGPSGRPGVTRGLPTGWQLLPYDCRLNIWGAHMRTDVTDTMSYYDVWTAAAMVAGVCVRRDLAGVHVNLGANKDLWVKISDGHDPDAMDNGNRTDDTSRGSEIEPE